jgi:hypothetical protein
MIHPVCRGAAGPKRVLEVAVEAFHHPVGLWVVNCHLSVLDVEQAAQSSPQGGGELGASVRCDDCWDSESAHPTLKQSIGAVKCCGGGDGYGFWPAGCPLNDGETL